jgi:methylated-DNA-[protein]-cysteine S-methyltransferase
MQNIINSPLGKLLVQIENNALIRISYLPPSATLNLQSQTSSLILELSKQLDAYFANSKFVFTIPINLEGTALQKSIWQSLRAIPPGCTKTYGELAKQLNTGPRIIGNACRANPIPIIIPCHRVVGANNLGGYSGDKSGQLMDIKKWLLHHEQKS